jgi:hypothetical protein
MTDDSLFKMVMPPHHTPCILFAFAAECLIAVAVRHADCKS